MSTSSRSKVPGLSWGLGVELESHFFLIDKETGERQRLAQVVGLWGPYNKLDLLEALKDTEQSAWIKKHFGLTNEEIELFLSSSIDPKLERSAKLCAGLQYPKAQMLELLNVDFRNRTVQEVASEIVRNTGALMSVANKLLRDDAVRAAVKVGSLEGRQLVRYPFGAAVFEDPLGGRVLKDYTGSVQFTITLPHFADTSASAFTLMHERFGNQLQWLEPLLVACLFTPDPSCVVGERFVHAAYRTVRYGWGNFAGTDVRRLHKGVGRSANVEPLWRRGLDVRNLSDLKSPKCMRLGETDPSSVMDVMSGKFGKVSSDLRTFGFERHKRVSGFPMTTGQGFEFRIFDNFDVRYLEDVMTMIMYVAENSRRCEYLNVQVYKDADWISALRDIIMDGWHARVRQAYLDKLCRVLELPRISALHKTASVVAGAVFSALQRKNRGGEWLQHLLGKRHASRKFVVPDLNRGAWLHFYKCAFASTTRRAISQALNTFKLRQKFTAAAAKKLVKTPHLRRTMQLYLDAERSAFIVRAGTDTYARVRRIPVPLARLTLECRDRSSYCSVEGEAAPPSATKKRRRERGAGASTA